MNLISHMVEQLTQKPRQEYVEAKAKAAPRNRRGQQSIPKFSTCLQCGKRYSPLRIHSKVCGPLCRKLRENALKKIRLDARREEDSC